METETYRDQMDRSRRLLAILNANDWTKVASGLDSEDIVVFAAQCIWHVKDWILNDPTIDDLDVRSFNDAVHQDLYLMACADIANGSKHLRLENSKVGARLSEAGGIHLSSAEGVFKRFHYVVAEDKSLPFHGMEVRHLFDSCMENWERLIDRFVYHIEDSQQSAPENCAPRRR